MTKSVSVHPPGPRTGAQTLRYLSKEWLNSDSSDRDRELTVESRGVGCAAEREESTMAPASQAWGVERRVSLVDPKQKKNGRAANPANSRK